MALTAALTCRKCRRREFFAQMSESGTYLILVCVDCTEPLLFAVDGLPEFPNPQEIVLEMIR